MNENKLMNKTIKVIQIIDSLHPGGAEMMAVNIANGLYEQGVESHLCATRVEGSLKNNIANGVGYLFLNRKHTIDIQAILKLQSYVTKHQITIVHAHSSSFFVAVLLKILKPSIQIIWHDHYGNSELLHKRKSIVLKFCSYFFKTSIAVNQLLLDWATINLHSKNKMYLANFAHLNTTIQKETFLEGVNGKRILCLANLRPQKDHLNLLNAFKIVHQYCPDWTLHLVGTDLNDQYASELKEFIQKERLQAFVFIYGNCADTFEILKQASIGVLASKSEGLPVSLLEYGLVSLPVVATDVGAIRNVIIANKTGILIPAANHLKLSEALLNLINNKDASVQLGAALHIFVTKYFSKEKYINELINRYQFV